MVGLNRHLTPPSNPNPNPNPNSNPDPDPNPNPNPIPNPNPNPKHFVAALHYRNKFQYSGYEDFYADILDGSIAKEH